MNVSLPESFEDAWARALPGRECAERARNSAFLQAVTLPICHENESNNVGIAFGHLPPEARLRYLPLR
jgi:hypothetical protein